MSEVIRAYKAPGGRRWCRSILITRQPSSTRRAGPQAAASSVGLAVSLLITASAMGRR